MKKEDAAALRWLVVTIRRAGRHAVAHYLQQLRHEDLVDSLEQDVASTTPDVLEDDLSLREALDRLPARERTVLLLGTVLDLPQRRIAMMLGISQTRVSQLRRQALFHMRQFLMGGDPDD